LVALLIGIGASVLGLYVSFWFDVASGATIVLVQTATFLIALMAGPRGGLLRRRA
jgi:manganese/iron transport system permease protein